MTGFRRSHAAAIAAQRLVAGGDGERLTTHREVEVVALAGQDDEQVAEFVASVLGPLARAATPPRRGCARPCASTSRRASTDRARPSG